PCHWRRPSTATHAKPAGPRISVTHPFHPLSGREFELVTARQAWGEDRVYFHDEAGRLLHMPLEWTSAEAPDPFRTLAAGRCQFRPADLLRLADLIAEPKARVPGAVRGLCLRVYGGFCQL